MDERFEVRPAIPARAATNLDVVTSPEGHVAIEPSGLTQGRPGPGAG